MIVTISGASGVGKSATMAAVVKRLACSKVLTSCTTRAPRPTDVPGEYRYFTDEAFDIELRERRFLWFRELHGSRYGTHQATVEEALQAAQYFFVGTLSLDVLSVLRRFARSRRRLDDVFSFFIFSPPEEVLRARLAKRPSSPEEIERRIADCRGWDEEARHSDVPFIGIQDRNNLEEKIRLVLANLKL